jgi:alanine racemase
MVTERMKTWVEVDLDLVAHNIQTIRGALQGDAMIMAVVKADAYGHGMTEVAAVALENGVEWLGVTTLEEGMELRQAGFEAPVLLLGITEPADADLVVKHNLVQTICTFDLAQALSDAAVANNSKALVHLKVDTGLSRFGVMPEQACDFAEHLKALPGIELQGIFSHFASPYEEDAYNEHQLAVFKSVIEALQEKNIDIPIKHIANSAAMIEYPHMHMDMVRCGFILCNDSPARHTERGLPLKDALSWKTRIVYTKNIPEGTSIGYAQSYFAPRDMTIAIVQMGYSDGFSTALSNKAEMLVHGHRVPVVGKVAMSHVVVDVTDIPNPVQAGDEAVLIGSQEGEVLTVVDMSSKAGAGDAETLCRISKKLPRVYFKGGQVMKVKESSKA